MAVIANPEAAERERLCREARTGVCPTCGGYAHPDKRLREYTEANTRLHKRVSELEVCAGHKHWSKKSMRFGPTQEEQDG